MKALLTGNEAIARGAWEAGVLFASAYPGTPSTEILENLARYQEVSAQWAPNEKVALETGIGASLAGARVLVAMKHVGVNVAADPLFTFSYTGVNGGLVLVSADDPGMHSSQNEQDNRHLGAYAKVPILEPADSQEAKDLVGLAFWLSETFDTPVILRLTTRVAHGKSLVKLGEREERGLPPFKADPGKFVMVPANARRRHVAVEERMEKLREFSEDFSANRIEWGKDRRLGIITSGISYHYAREALGEEASYLKLALIYPLPEKTIKKFAEEVEELYVIEELDPVIENQVRALGLKVRGKEVFPILGELSPELVAAGFRGQGEEVAAPQEGVVPRPPVMCPGCPHRGAFYVLKKLKVVVTGDIGCYSLGVAPPLSAMHSLICMGASVSNAFGFQEAYRAAGGEGPEVVAVIGDSTFLHSGMTGLLNVVYNGGRTTTIILDNDTTAMTGHQDHPATGMTLKGVPAPRADLEKICRALGVEDVRTVDAYKLAEVEAEIRAALQHEGPSVVIVRRPCVLLKGRGPKGYYVVDQDLCRRCRLCLRLGCPAIEVRGEQTWINETLCNGCSLCEQVCPFNAIVRGGEESE
ncbi:MAG: indolepyruvate ferredoxin oxidoreductase subunit alpha [bacterium]|nr:indolepyruvate ferredoxin oxidoreductase subunit alpha [Bacillota bacterium]HHW54162.1 indolepyruvate ferredoxin oxidoreductase subunit alpha [Bacillota bacterium]